jgi:GNAT superfamily N-acetyltransferase
VNETAGVLVSCRYAGDSDLPAVAALARAAREGVADGRGGPELLAGDERRGDEHRQMAELVDDSRAVLVVGLLDDIVVGYGVAARVALRDGGERARLEELYIEPDARQVGVGDAVLRAVLEWAASHACDGLDGLALPGDRATKNFFESHGMVARAIITHRPIDAAGRAS